MDIIRQETSYVVGGSALFGSSGNPSPVTAYGVYRGMKAAAKVAFSNDFLEGKTVAVQGVGQAAYSLCEFLYKEGAKLLVTDVNQKAVQRVAENFGAKAIDPDDIYGVECDIFSPCALGAILNDETIPQLQARVIAGGANNQLSEERRGDLIYEKGIVYAPDYVISAGGVINVAEESMGYDRERAMKKVEELYDRLMKVFNIAQRDGIPTYKAADRLAQERIEAAYQSKNKPKSSPF